VYIAKDGKWYTHPDLADITTYSSNKLTVLLKKTKPSLIGFGDNKLTLTTPGVRSKTVTIDIAFPATHGTYGEDGALMGVFEMAGVPYVGCGQAASAIAMNKVTAKWVALVHDVPTAAFISFRKKDVEENLTGLITAIEKRFKKLPLFVKPAHLGSSIGITKVDDFKDLANAIEVAAHYDDEILVEEGIQNLIEVTVPILGNAKPRTALVERPLLDGEEFFDFDQKYIGQGKKGGAKSGEQSAQGYSELPAKLPKDLYTRCEAVALQVYQAIGCEGTARVDLLIDKKADKVYFNELNPLPGSLYAHNWNKAGVASAKLVAELVELALERAARRQSLATSFDTNFLSQF
jgi:D-alanine-D-alanine ligase